MVLKAAKGMMNNPKAVADLIDLSNLSGSLREFIGQSQISRLGCFLRLWTYIKENKLQDSRDGNIVNCDDKLKGIMLGKSQIELSELPFLVKLHFPKSHKPGKS
ncbi:SWIB/MDM2 domain superfamily protein [Wolffia australiana]